MSFFMWYIVSEVLLLDNGPVSDTFIERIVYRMILYFKCAVNKHRYKYKYHLKGIVC